MRGPLTKDEWAKPWDHRLGGSETVGKDVGELRQSNVMSTGFEQKPILNQETQFRFDSRKSSSHASALDDQSYKSGVKTNPNPDKESSVMAKFSPSIRGTLLEKYIRESKENPPTPSKLPNERRLSGPLGVATQNAPPQSSNETLESKTSSQETGRAVKDTLRTSRDDFTELLAEDQRRNQANGVGAGDPQDTLRSGANQTAVFEGIDSSRGLAAFGTDRLDQHRQRAPLSERSDRSGNIPQNQDKAAPNLPKVTPPDIPRPFTKPATKNLAAVLEEQAQFDKENQMPIRTFMNLDSKKPSTSELKRLDTKPTLPAQTKVPALHQTETFRDLNADWMQPEDHSAEKSQNNDVSRVDLSGYSGRESLNASRLVKDPVKSHMDFARFEREKVENEALLRASVNNLEKIKEFQRSIARVKPAGKVSYAPSQPSGMEESNWHRDRQLDQMLRSHVKSSPMVVHSQVLKPLDVSHKRTQCRMLADSHTESRLSGIMHRSRSPITPWMVAGDHSEVPAVCGLFGQPSSRMAGKQLTHRGFGQPTQDQSFVENRKNFVGMNPPGYPASRQSRGVSQQESEINQFGRGFFSFKEGPEEPSRREAGGFPTVELDTSNISKLFEATSRSQLPSPINRADPDKRIPGFSPMNAKNPRDLGQEYLKSPVIFEEDYAAIDSARDRVAQWTHSRSQWQGNYSGLGYEDLELTLKLHSKEDLTIKSNLTAVLEF